MSVRPRACVWVCLLTGVVIVLYTCFGIAARLLAARMGTPAKMLAQAATARR